MNCPVCKTPSFSEKTLLDDLHVLQCSTCSGYWLKSYHYWLWLKTASDSLAAPYQCDLMPNDSTDTKICPECFRLLSRYKVGHDTDIAIDRCGTCRGLWFDKNEWELLRSKNLHDEIHLIFSSHWQQDVQREQVTKNRARALTSLIGDEAFGVVDGFSQWLRTQENRVQILGFLNQFRD